MSSPAAGDAQPVSGEEIRRQAQRVLSSGRFAAAGRQRRFLDFTIGKVLAGQQDDVKEYLIALEVYDRKPDYDPKVDSIVRVEASRVRTRLREYYDNEGARDPIVIELPKGSYVPVFRRAASPPDVTDPAQGGVLEPSPPAAAFPLKRQWMLPAVALVVLIAAASWAILRPRRDAVLLQTISIPPFTNLSTSPEAGQFTRAIAKEIESGLTQSGRLRVVVHNREAKSLPDFVLEGTVREDEGSQRILVQLLSSRDGGYVWSQGFAEAGAGAENLARAIARHTESQAAQYQQEHNAAGTPRARALQLLRQARGLQAARGVQSMDSDGLMLRGTAAIERLELSQLNQSISLLEQAVAADPKLAVAHSVLSSYYQVAAEYDPRMTDKARESARRATALEPRLGEAHGNLAYIYFLYDWNAPAAAEEFRLALEYEPRILSSYRLGADALTIAGRHDDALQVLDNARRVYPNHPVVETSVAVAEFNAGRFAQAERTARANLKRFPEFHLSHWILGIALEQLGRYDEALSEIQQCLQRSKDDARCTAALGHLYGKTGKRTEAEAILAKYRARPQTFSRANYIQALIHNGLGETERAYTELEAARNGREFDLPYLPVEPRFANLRGQPRFQQFLRKAGLLF
ncbi:MAG: tetratricopeptide repeat protein [Acidobacteria bacterium]|nr:tetratricopeptide repeat protein [Acidobacteriota bacterium]